MASRGTKIYVSADVPLGVMLVIASTVLFVR
jgi:hypothetical protein